MELYVKDSEYNIIAVLDSFVSLIWTKRYYQYGDFELVIPAAAGLLDIIKQDYYIIREDDDTVMIIESILIQTDAEDGNVMIISGRSLESILLRRVFMRQYTINHTGTLAGLVLALVERCMTSYIQDHPDYRRIAGLTVDTSSSFEGTMSVQFTGDTLLSAIISLCRPKEIGIKMQLVESSLILSLYQGADTDVIFSPEFDNVISSKYSEETRNLANFVTVAGEGEGNDRTTCDILNGRFADITGLKLREGYVDARNVSSNGGEISGVEYLDIMTQKGYDYLSEHSVDKTFESEVEPDMTYHYKTDYNLGDKVTVQNDFGITSRPRIVEIIESWDATGYKVIPTFDELKV